MLMRGRADHNFVKDFEHFLAEAEYTRIQTVRELIQFNDDHAELELPPGT